MQACRANSKSAIQRLKNLKICKFIRRVVFLAPNTPSLSRQTKKAHLSTIYEKSKLKIKLHWYYLSGELDNSPTRRFAAGRSPTRRFADRHFAARQFADEAFRRHEYESLEAANLNFPLYACLVVEHAYYPCLIVGLLSKLINCNRDGCRSAHCSPR